MKICLLFVFVGYLAVATAAPKVNLYKKAEPCDPKECVLPNCRCSGTDIPGGLTPQQTPQFVYLTFDDAVTGNNIKYYHEAFAGRKNPDGCPISTTYFISHEYTDYSLVHELHAHGHEIALHSISHKPLTDYWKHLSTADQVEEFGGEKELLSYFADIDIEDIKGMRLPLLQLSANNSFEAAKQIGLKYDCSWPTRSFNVPRGIWPYTLDYASTQDCPLGPCPDASLPGLWVSPMIMSFDDLGVECSMIDACTNIPEDAEGIFEFLVKNFKYQYDGNRAPFGLYMHAAWFEQRENAFEAYKMFLDYVQELNDVYLVSVSKGLEWVQNPTPVEELGSLWPTCQKTYEPTCTKPTNCKLKNGAEERYMMVCSDECPEVYPWLGNPLGKE